METLKRNSSPILMRNYGRIIQDLIAYTCTVEDEEKRNALTIYIGQCMRQKNIAWNKDSDAGSNRVKDDIIALSHGKLQCDFEQFDQAMQRRVAAPANTNNGNNKKKKK